MLSERITNWDKKNLLAKFTPALTRNPQEDTCINLSSGNPYCPPPQAVKNKFLASLENRFAQQDHDHDDLKVHNYRVQTEVEPSLRDQLLRYCTQQDGLIGNDIDVTVGQGTTQLFWVALHALLDEGEVIITPRPYYSFFDWGATALNNRLLLIDTTENNDHKLTAGGLEEALQTNHPVKALLLSNPTNPTGAVYSETELKELVDVLTKPPYQKIYIIADEVYDQTVFSDDVSFISLATLPAIRNRTILLKSLSKTHGLARERLGFAVGPKSIIQAMATYLFRTMNGVSALSQDLMSAALTETPAAHFEQCNAHYRENLQSLQERICQFNQTMKATYLTDDVDYLSLVVIPKAGFFACLSFGGFYQWRLPNGHYLTDDIQLVTLLSQEAKVSVLPGSLQGFNTHALVVRITFSQHKAVLEQGMQQIQAYFTRCFT